MMMLTSHDKKAIQFNFTHRFYYVDPFRLAFFNNYYASPEKQGTK